MKLKFKLLALLVISALSLSAREYSKEIHKGFVKSGIQSLEVNNKFGEINIVDLGGDSITVDVIITVENAVESKAEQLMGQIDIQINKKGSILVLVTNIKDDFKSKQSFSIDYQINIPEDRNLTVTNKFGNVAVASLKANGDFTIDYGNFNSGPMTAPSDKSIKFELSYGKADIQSVNQLNATIKYSKMFLGEAGIVGCNSKYSVVKAEVLDRLDLDSKYDQVQVEELGALNSISKYTNYDIEELSENFVLNTEYGSVRIEEAGPEFKLIDIENSYGGIAIGFAKPEFALNAECSYCDVKLSDGLSFNGNRIKDNFKLNLSGSVGDAASTSKVKIISRYGGVKLSNE